MRGREAGGRRPFDFLLFSLPDNDSYSHKEGPAAQPASIAEADRALTRLMDAAGGPDAFLDDHAMIVMSDHSHDLVEAATNLADALDGWRVLEPVDMEPERAQLAVCPASRSAQVYVLDADDREAVAARAGADLEGVPGIDVIMRLEGGRAVVWTPRGRLTFAPGDGPSDQRGNTWHVDGELAALDLSVGRRFAGLRRLPGRAAPAVVGADLRAHRRRCCCRPSPATSSPTGAAPTTWAAAATGRCIECDSLGVLLTHGVGPERRPDGAQWSIEDVTPMVLEHFGAVESA